ncbi:MAG: AraC family transcriptional regulator [Pelomonas sp.]|nr:AraC family transcriptional regulator [Roseateles sp.]
MDRRSSDLAQPADYLRQMAEQLDDLGLDAGAWLARRGLSRAQLDEPGDALPLAVFGALVSDALALADEPALGLLVGQRLVVHTHGMLGFAAQHCATLRQVVALIEQYLSLRTPFVTVRHEVGGASVLLLLDERVPLGEIRRSVLEAIVLALKNILEFLALPLRPVVEVAFPFGAPEYAGLARDIVGCPIRYRRARASVTLSLALFDQPLRALDVDAFRTAAEACADELNRLTERNALASRVRRLLLDKGTSGFPSLPTTARLLHLTPRTLHRRLVGEGTSFGALLAEVRHSLALHHLQAGALSVDAIAAALGYADVANFRRAFRRRGGRPPSAFRQTVDNPTP